MTLVAPVNLKYNVKTLWFDPNGLDIHARDKLVVETARGVELGVAQSDLIEVSEDQISAMRSPLKPVLRIATEEDLEKADEMERLASEAMPVFRELARETSEDMHPVSVEYMLDGDKAVFYFESENRIDFRELVKKLASRFRVRIDMKQIGVRDEARIVGGIAHCGQLVCCKRLGGEFKPVSIRMAKDQDLSLNSQKISGLCGRLMCCLRYEEQAYKEVKAEAPKPGASAHTPVGDGKVVDIDVPKETVSIKVGDDKPVSIPLSGISEMSDDRKSCAVDDEAWEKAVEAANTRTFGDSGLFTISSFTGEDKVGEAKAVHHVRANDSDKHASKKKGSTRSRSRKGSGDRASGSDKPKNAQSKPRQRRRSTKINVSSGEKSSDSNKQSSSGKQSDSKRKIRPGHRSSGLSRSDAHPSDKADSKQSKGNKQSSKDTADRSGSSPRRRRRRSHGKSSSSEASAHKPDAGK